MQFILKEICLVVIFLCCLVFRETIFEYIFRRSLVFPCCRVRLSKMLFKYNCSDFGYLALVSVYSKMKRSRRREKNFSSEDRFASSLWRTNRRQYEEEKDLVELCDKLLIPPQHQNFFNDLIVSGDDNKEENLVSMKCFAEIVNNNNQIVEEVQLLWNWKFLLLSFRSLKTIKLWNVFSVLF